MGLAADDGIAAEQRCTLHSSSPHPRHRRGI